MTRDPTLIHRLLELVGTDVLRLTDFASGWPAFADLASLDGPKPVALYVGRIGSGGRPTRLDVERRFQNPADRSPILDFGPSRPALLLGLWEGDARLPTTQPLVVLADAARRVNKRTRFPVFMSVSMLRTGIAMLWAEETNADNEHLLCFAPPLLPLAFEARRSGERPPSVAIQALIAQSGLGDSAPSQLDPVERVRQAATALVRQRQFGSRVRAAYANRCAMCGLGMRLVQAAHIHPVAAPASSDLVPNGLALCANHHVAFDNHDVAVVPGTGAIFFKPEFVRSASDDPMAQLLIGGTSPRLAPPLDPADQPLPSAFRKRYEYFEAIGKARYDWLPPASAPARGHRP